MYLENWVPKYSLLCRSKSEIGILGSAFFIGMITGLPWYPTLSDKIGRKKVFVTTVFLT